MSGCQDRIYILFTLRRRYLSKRVRRKRREWPSLERRTDQNKHKYLSGLCRRPYTEKSVTFSKQSLQTSHLARIEKLKSHQRNDKRMRSQKQKTYIRLLEGLRKEQEYYLEVLKLEEKELDLEISKF